MVTNCKWGDAISAFTLLLVPALLCGCLVGPDFHSPQSEMPASWIGPTTAPSTQQSVPNSQPVDLAQWWTVFNDPVLNSLIKRALDSNLGLRQATTRILQARASRSITGSALWPNVDTSASYRRVSALERQHDLYQAGLDATWEIDVFGGNRRAVESADAGIEAAIEDRRDVLVTLTAEVALNYLDLRGAQRAIEIAEQNLAAQQRSASLTRQLFNNGNGFVSRLDVVNADAAVATTASQIPSLEASERQTIYALSVLLALPPSALLDELSTFGPIPTVPPQVPVGLPSELLRRRPDIRRAEAQLHSDTASVGTAESDLFPRFSLTGSFGTTAAKPKGLLRWDNTFWSIGPNVSWPLFDAGRIRGNINLQKALADQSMLSFQQTVLVALQDVENALIAYEKEQQHREQVIVAVESNRQAVDLATQLYSAGRTAFLDVLNAQRSLYVTENALVQSDQTIATNLVALYKALGGGWEEEPSDHPTTQPAGAQPQ